MITSVFVTTPCPCGGRHRLPAPPDGVIRWLCGSKRRVFTLRLDPAQFQRLLATTPTEQQLHAEGLCVVHRADAPRDDQQRCDQCGWLLVSYRQRRRVFTAGPFLFWPTGAHVGRSIDGAYYLATLPPSPHRERLCYLPAAVH